jgi:hypothetical protein
MRHLSFSDSVRAELDGNDMRDGRAKLVKRAGAKPLDRGWLGRECGL